MEGADFVVIFVASEFILVAVRYFDSGRKISIQKVCYGDILDRGDILDYYCMDEWPTFI